MDRDIEITTVVEAGLFRQDGPDWFVASFQRLAPCLALFKGGVSRFALDGFYNYIRNEPALASLPLSDWSKMLAECRRRGVVRPHPADEDFLLFDDELTTVARACWNRDPSRSTKNAMEKCFYLTYLQGARWLLGLRASGVPAERARAQDVMRLEFDNLRFALERGVAHRALVNVLFTALREYLTTKGDRRRVIEIGCSTLAEINRRGSAVSVDAPFDRAAIMASVADERIELGEYEAAEAGIEEALRIASTSQTAYAAEQNRFLSTLYESLTRSSHRRRQWKLAKEHAERSLELAIASEHRPTQAKACFRLGVILSQVGNADESRHKFENASEIYVALGYRLAQARVSVELAKLAIEAGRLPEARRRLEAAIPFFAEFSDDEQRAVAHYHLAAVARREDRIKAAWNHLRRADRVWRDLGERRDRARCNLMLADLVEQIGEFAKAPERFAMSLQFANRALRLAVADGDRWYEAIVLEQLGRLHTRCRKFAKATSCYERALIAHRQFNNIASQIAIHLRLSCLAGKRNNVQELRNHLLAAIPLAKQLPEHMPIILRAAARRWRRDDSALPDVLAAALAQTSVEVEELLRNALRPN